MAIDFRQMRIEFVDESGQYADTLKSSATNVNSLQSQVKCEVVIGKIIREEYHLRWSLNDDPKRPYELKGYDATISLRFYKENRIVLDEKYYIGYMLSLILLEYLYHKQFNERYTALRSEDYSQINHFLWTGVVGQAAFGAEQNISRLLPEGKRLLMGALGTIRTGAYEQYQELLSRVKQTEVFCILNNNTRDSESYTLPESNPVQNVGG